MVDDGTGRPALVLGVSQPVATNDWFAPVRDALAGMGNPVASQAEVVRDANMYFGHAELTMYVGEDSQVTDANSADATREDYRAALDLLELHRALTADELASDQTQRLTRLGLIVVNDDGWPARQFGPTWDR
ncbi:hypothetical protein ACQ856_17315 [Mycolicibacterium psychrotolerans]|uniref:hypothetical protein n=1 Tax=Mycolicibacterium psychrotolerans TaxID=216929 RepID=UPI003D67318F